MSALQACARQPQAPFYAPGHKRGIGTPKILRDWLGSAMFAADLPELPELDNLFAPAGVIQSAQELAAAAFGADKTWFLVNGSSAGVMAAILATCNPGDLILLPRNVHQSAIAGLIFSGAVPVFLEPAYDPEWDLVLSITPAAVAAALTQYPAIRAVMMVYPTYQGICGEVAAIAAIAHQHSIPLLVDEAHGPHLGFHPDLPQAALAAGADLAVQSTHKVLSALSQAAMLHLKSDRIDPDRLSQALQLVQSTSPNYLLLASLDAARQQMATQGTLLLTQVLAMAEQARHQLRQISGLAVLESGLAGSPGFRALDQTRLTVDVSGLGISGFAADEILRQQGGVTAELPLARHLTFIISLGNTTADLAQLVQGFSTLAQASPGKESSSGQNFSFPHLLQEISLPRLSPQAAFFARTEMVSAQQAPDRISAELICPYPPGIPVLLPGELITPEAIDYLDQVIRAGGTITGYRDGLCFRRGGHETRSDSSGAPAFGHRTLTTLKVVQA